MNKKILLPNNGFGVLIMLALIILTFTVALLSSFWLASLVAPWWVAAPFSLLVAIVTMLLVVKKA